MRMRRMLSLALCVPVIALAAACNPFYGPYERDPYGGPGAYERDVSAAEVRRALEYNEHVDADDIRVETRGSTVYLSGEVPSDHQADEAYRAARSVRGVRDVVMDRLYVERTGHHG